jgi:hemolysin III
MRKEPPPAADEDVTDFPEQIAFRKKVDPASGPPPAGLRRYLLEPASSLTHAAAALAALLGAIWLIYLTWGQPAKMVTMAIYGLSMILLFSASALLHGVRLPEHRRMGLNRLDHAAIFLLIAGTYTPIVYNLFPAEWGRPLLVGIWLLSLIGMAYKLFSRRIHGFFNASVYPLLAWAGVVPAFLAYRVEPFVHRGGLVPLFLGGLIYMLGFVVYYWHWPDPWPDVFGHHEIWHVLVMAGSACHFTFMALYVAPA